MDLSCEMRSPLSTKKKIEIRIFRFFNCFSKMWKIREKYKTESIGERAEPYPTPILTLKKRKEKLL